MPQVCCLVSKRCGCNVCVLGTGYVVGPLTGANSGKVWCGMTQEMYDRICEIEDLLYKASNMMDNLAKQSGADDASELAGLRACVGGTWAMLWRWQKRAKIAREEMAKLDAAVERSYQDVPLQTVPEGVAGQQ